MTERSLGNIPTWQAWLPEYGLLIIEVQEMVEEHNARGTWERRPSRREYLA